MLATPAEWARRISLDGAVNFRDVGGYPTGDGSTVRTGRVFRSDALHTLSTADFTTLRTLRIARIYDLRAPREQETSPPALSAADGVQTLPVSLAASDAQEHSLREYAGHVTADNSEELTERFLLQLYRGTAFGSARAVGEILAGLARSPEPAVIMCSVGKDRTGVVAALLLLTLGVDEELVLDDYELSREYQDSRRTAELVRMLGGVGVPAALAAGLLGVRRQAMATFLDELRQHHGGVEDYLTGAAGLVPAIVQDLQAALLVQPTRTHLCRSTPP